MLLSFEGLKQHHLSGDIWNRTPTPQSCLINYNVVNLYIYNFVYVYYCTLSI